MIVDWNGQLVEETSACVSLAGQPGALSDGIYETLRCYKGVPFDLDSHIRRLREAAAVLQLDTDVNQVRWRSRIDNLLQANQLLEQDARIRIVLHRAVNMEISDSVNTAILAWGVASNSLQERQQRGIAVVTAAEPRLANSQLYQLKSLNLLATVLAQLDARKSSADDALFLNSQGEICEATYANVFAVVGREHLKTPPVSSPCLAGITRMHVLRIARREGWKVEEAPLSIAQLALASEVFLTSSISEIMPVIRLNGRVIGEGRPGPACGHLQQKYRELVHDFTSKAAS